MPVARVRPHHQSETRQSLPGARPAVPLPNRWLDRVPHFDCCTKEPVGPMILDAITWKHHGDGACYGGRGNAAEQRAKTTPFGPDRAI